MEIRWTFSSRSPRRATLFNSIWKVTMTRVDRQSSHSGAATLSRARWSHMAACTCSKRARNCRNCSPRGWPLKLKKKREREREREGATKIMEIKRQSEDKHAFKARVGRATKIFIPRVNSYSYSFDRTIAPPCLFIRCRLTRLN